VARALAADPPALLMDEPFGAIDPINRERLQNEFLRLQAKLSKTVLFVTHDIDEAIKMGDRIAVMQSPGRLLQYAPPAELLTSPANDYVAQFVGADRALKRLALQRVRDVDLWRAALVRAGEDLAAVRARVEDSDLDIALVVDDRGRPVRWLSERDLRGDGVPPGSGAGEPPLTVELDDVLRDALGRLLSAESQYAPVLDARGTTVGVLSMEAIGHALHLPADRAGSSSELVAE
jgi:osmoprotectant transport system ATP-binding protein